MTTEYMQGNADNAISVPFSDDRAEATPRESNDAEDAELFDEDDPAEAPEKRKERKQRRQERLQGMLQNGRQATARVRELEERDRQRERELAELRGMVTVTAQRQQQQQPGVDPWRARLDDINQRQADAYSAAQAEMKAGTMTPERQRYYERQATAFEEEKGTLFAEKVLAQRAPAQAADQARQVWVNKYPEVYGNPEAYQFAEGTFARKKALLKRGEQVTNELVDEVMRETMATFKLGAKPPPTRNERDRLSGIASGGGGGGSANIQLTPEMRRMAIAAYDHLPEDQAIKAWTAKTGRKMASRGK